MAGDRTAAKDLRRIAPCREGRLIKEQQKRIKGCSSAAKEGQTVRRSTEKRARSIDRGESIFIPGTTQKKKKKMAGETTHPGRRSGDSKRSVCQGSKLIISPQVKNKSSKTPPDMWEVRRERKKQRLCITAKPQAQRTSQNESPKEKIETLTAGQGKGTAQPGILKNVLWGDTEGIPRTLKQLSSKLKHENENSRPGPE